MSDYASVVWGSQENQISNSIHYRVIQAFLGVHNLTSVLTGDTGWEPPNIRLKCEMLQLWNRLVRMSDQRLTKKKI